MTNIPYTLTDTSLTLILNYTPYTIPTTHPNWQAIIDGLADGANDNDILTLIDIPQAVANFMQGNVEIRDRVLYLKGKPIETRLANYILDFMESNDPRLAAPLCAFLENVMENPSYRAVDGLYEWVKRSNMPITPDGHLLAWKIVGPDYKDIYSKTFDNSVGQIVEQPRNQCNEDPDQTCSYGLHFCSYDYLPHYGNTDNRRIMVVKINPRDVVAFPRDYNISKGRCCRYEVVAEVAQDKVRELFPENERVYWDVWGEDQSEEIWTWDDVVPAVGQIWETRDGRKVQIVQIDADSDLVGFSHSWLFYSTGMLHKSWDSNEDVVKFISH